MWSFWNSRLGAGCRPLMWRASWVETRTTCGTRRKSWKRPAASPDSQPFFSSALPFEHHLPCDHRVTTATGARLVQRRGVAVRHVGNRRHDLGDGPKPPPLRRPEARAHRFEDVPDDLAIGENVVVLVLPLAGR